jgi:hypothetical protein
MRLADLRKEVKEKFIKVTHAFHRETKNLSVLTELTSLYSLIRLASSKGKYPAIRTNKIMPQDHTSAAIPS